MNHQGTRKEREYEKAKNIYLGAIEVSPDYFPTYSNLAKCLTETNERESAIKYLKKCLEIKEIKPIMKLIIRGKTKDFITAIGKNLNMVLPTEANTSTSAEKLTAFWLSPDEWMLISNETVSEDSNTYQVEDELIKNISKVKLGAVTNVSDQFVMLNIKGSKVP